MDWESIQEGKGLTEAVEVHVLSDIGIAGCQVGICFFDDQCCKGEPKDSHRWGD